MAFPFTFFQVAVALLLVGVLSARGLALRSPLFTAYLAWFALSTATLWVVAQAALGTRAYETLYIAVYAPLLALSTLLVLRRSSSGWLTVALTLAAIAFLLHPALALRVNGLSARAASFDFLTVAFHLAYGGWALGRGLLHASDPFDAILLKGLGAFWLGQAVASAFYVAGVVGLRQPHGWTTNLAAALGALALLGMAFAFFFTHPMPADSAAGARGEDKKGGWWELAGAQARRGER